MTAPLIFDVVRGAVEDGPGLRTVIFFKGCPLRCRWCHNPESHAPGPELRYAPEQCRHCGACQAACPTGAIALAREPRVQRARCTACGRCAAACPSLALRLVGQAWSLPALVELVLRDKVYFDVSGGGVTLSGGEPLLHPEFVGALAQRLKDHGIHVAVQTAGDFDYERFARAALPWLDLIYFDLKLADPEEHRRDTGADNRRLLANLARLAAAKPGALVPRIALVPEYTARPDNLRQLAGILRQLQLRDCHFLTYNPSGTAKYAQLGKPCPPDLPARPLSQAAERAHKALFWQALGKAPPAPRETELAPAQRP